MTVEVSQLLSFLGPVVTIAVAWGMMRADRKADREAIVGLKEAFSRLADEIKPLAITTSTQAVQIQALQIEQARQREDMSKLGLFMQTVQLQVAKWGHPAATEKET